MAGTICPSCKKRININVKELVSSNTKKRGVKNGIIKCPHCNSLISIGIDRNNKIRNTSLVDLYDKELENQKTVDIVSEESLLIEFINSVKKTDLNKTPIISDKSALNREWNYLKSFREEINNDVNKVTSLITELISNESTDSIIMGVKMIYPLKIIKDYLMNKSDETINKIVSKVISDKQQTLNKIIELESKDKKFIDKQISSLELTLNELNKSLTEKENKLRQFQDYLNNELARIDLLYDKWNETKNDYSKINELKELIKNFFADINIVKTIVETYWDKKNNKFKYDNVFTGINDLPNYFIPKKGDEQEVLFKLKKIIDNLGIDLNKNIITQLEEIKNNFLIGINGFNDYLKIVNAYNEQIIILEEELESLKNKNIKYDEELTQALTSKGIKKSMLEKKLIKEGKLIKGSNYKIIRNNNELILYYNGKLSFQSVISSGYALMNAALTSDDEELNIIIEAGEDVKEVINNFIIKTKEYANNRLKVLEEAASNYIGKEYKQFIKENKELVKTLNHDEKTLIKHIIEDSTKEKKNKLIKSTIKKALIRGVEVTLAAILGLPRIGLASKYYSLRNESITRISEITRNEEIFNESIRNGDARKVIDTIDLYENIILGEKDPGISPKGIDEERMFSDPNYAWYVSNQYIDENKVGIDINGDGVMGVVENPFYKESNNWDNSQKQGIEILIQHYTDLKNKDNYTLSTNLLYNITHFNQLNPVSKTYTETIITATIMGAFIIYEGIKAAKKLIEKRKYGPLGKFDITKFMDKKIKIK